ncbi:YczE/YyaS/YitT family protein [Brevibacillus ginsengisoli]|uniref:YczE/YyaS/YitT family protein n=1 Tax=Brevibacillus ginsengisoli TaxID=363854 RepID=UPI003CF860A1
MIIRYVMFTLGLAVIAFGSMLCIRANFGVAPWEVFHIGLQKTFGLTIGTWSQLVGVVVMVISYLVAKIKPGIPMILNVLFFGWFLDIFLWLDIAHADLLFTRIIQFSLGMILTAIGIGMYISPRLGAGPRDSLMLAFHEKRGWSIQRVRTCIEVCVLLIGWFLGGPVNVGTLLIAVLTGPMIQKTIPFWENLMEKPYGMRLPDKIKTEVA